MPRDIIKKPRLIYPQIATSLSLTEVSMEAELLFWRILPQADDQGRLPGDPKQLKALACPMRSEITEAHIPQYLAELKDAGIIIYYSNSSTIYIQIAKWWDYQSSMRRIFPSHHPPPQGWQDRVKGVRSDGQTGRLSAFVRYKPEPELEPEPEEKEVKEKEIGAFKPKTDDDDATAAAETAVFNIAESSDQETHEDSPRVTVTAWDKDSAGFQETHEDSPRVTVTAWEYAMLEFLETLEGWRIRRAEDIAWLKEFCQDWPAFGLPSAKACRDYYSGRPAVRHKGIWKNRFRTWMVLERNKGGDNGAHKRHPGDDRWDPGKPLRRDTGARWDPNKPLR